MWVNTCFEGFRQRGLSLCFESFSERGPSLVLRVSTNVGRHLF